MQKYALSALAALLAGFGLAGAVPAKPNNAYAVMQKYYQNLGGLDKLRAETTSFYEGSLTIEGVPIVGTIKEWRRSPDRVRQEVDLTVFRQTTGDNGIFAWEVDANGKVQMKLDQRSLQDRRLSAALSRYEHLDSTSALFRLALAPEDKVDGQKCYVVRRTNTLNSDTTLDYIRASDFLLVQTVEKKPDMTQIVLFADYREVAGVKRPFEQKAEIRPVGQKQTVKLSSFEVNLPIEDSRFEPPASSVQDFKFKRGFAAENIPFQFIENHIYLPVTIAGKERSWVLDCGAGKTVIDAGFAGELGLELAGELTAQGAAGAATYSFATLPGFSLPGVEFDPQQVIALSITPLFRQLVGTDVAGILGYDFLSRFVTKIDYAAKKVSFYLPDSFKYKGKGVELSAPLQNNVPTVEAVVDGRYAGRWRLDIGATGTSFHYPFAQEHGLLNREGIAVTASGAGGSFELNVSRFDSIGLGGYSIAKPAIAVPTTAGAGALASAELVGNIGNDALRRFVLYLDYAHQRVILEPGKDFKREFPRDRSGLGLSAGASGVVVTSVPAGTPGAEAGLLSGDVVLKVNGRQVDLIALREMLRGKPGTKHVLTVRRGEEELKLTVKLRDIF